MNFFCVRIVRIASIVVSAFIAVMLIPLNCLSAAYPASQHFARANSSALAVEVRGSSNSGLPPLPYDYNALEPFIDEQTMRIHHDRYHAAYVSNLTLALAKYPKLRSLPVEQLLSNIDKLPQNIQTVIRNNGGGDLNHRLFWQALSPQFGESISGQFAAEITQTYGGFDEFKDAFSKAAASVFGSGWVWLVRNPQKQLSIMTTVNQDSPVMTGNEPLLGLDLWEHAYCFRHQNRRADYLNSWWQVVNWKEVERRSQASMKK